MTKKGLSNELFFSKTRDYLCLYLEHQCNKSHHTIKAYRDALTIFRHYVLEIKKITIRNFKFEDCTRDFILDFIAYLQKEKYAATTINQRLSAIKAYLWYVGDGDILVQPIALSISRVPFLKNPKRSKPIISPEALTALLSAPLANRIGTRDKAMMIILYDSAMRMDELLQLKVGDVNMYSEAPYIRIHGKGDKERIVSITAKTLQHVKFYLKHYHKEDVEKDNLLFYTIIDRQRKQMSPNNFERIIKKYADKIRPDFPDLPLSVHPHLLRRTRATNLYQDGVDLELISRILGHSSIETTRQHYAMPSIEMIRKAMQESETELEELPLWDDDEQLLAKFCGIR